MKEQSLRKLIAVISTLTPTHRGIFTEYLKREHDALNLMIFNMNPSISDEEKHQFYVRWADELEKGEISKFKDVSLKEGPTSLSLETSGDESEGDESEEDYSDEDEGSSELEVEGDTCPELTYHLQKAVEILLLKASRSRPEGDTQPIPEEPIREIVRDEIRKFFQKI